jgi:hypothetical protein
MKRYVLFSCVSLLMVLPAFAQYLNDTRLHDKSDGFLSGETQSIPHGDNLLFSMKRYLPDSTAVDPENITVGVHPNIKVPPPRFTVVDSVDSENLRVLRTLERGGSQAEEYHFIPLEEYTRENLDKSLLSTWRDNKARMTGWTPSEKGGGIADLDFAIPVGKRFEQLVGGKTRLDINGSQTITFSGKSEYDEGRVETSLTKNSSFPSLSMKQEPQFTIRGMVGDRITVDIKQESNADGFSLGGSLEDNISLRYKGEPNDIIQTIEAGNTSLTLEGATFAGYSGSHKGLFGIRSEGRMGPIKFTAIASQEKSEAATKSFRGSAEETSSQIRDYNYKGNTYFFLDFRYRNRFAEYRSSLDQIYYDPMDSLVTIEVYQDDGNQLGNSREEQLSLPGIARPMNMDPSIPIKSQGISGFFRRLEPQKDYYVDRSLGYIVFRTRVQDGSTIGVYMKTKRGIELGSLAYNPDDTNSKIDLKIVKQRNQRPTDTDTWDLEWKNVYDLGQQNIEPEGLEIRIFRDTSDGPKRDTQNGIPIIQILGLDQQDELGGQKPDNKVDLNRSFVDLYRGELIFPILRPFDSEPPRGVTAILDPKVPTIYDSQNQQEKVEASKYYIEVKTASRQKTIRIDSVSGITEGTERITLNGKVLSRGTDYNIIYQTGEVTITNKDALSPTADLRIDYEEQNALESMQKSLMGLRTEYEFWGNSRIGGVVLYNNESTTDKRVKLGQEPSRTILFDTDATINYESQLLSTLVDKIPMVIADRKSALRFEGEMARSMPNMNTKGVVYVDDFEGTQNTPLSIGRTSWTLSSAPDPSSTGGIRLKRGRIQWYNPWDRVDSRTIWPKKETSTEENTVHVMSLAYGKPEGVSDNGAFAGVMNAFYGTGVDLSRSRFLEVWARGSKGKLKIDIGAVSEDFYPLDAPNDFLDTEDRPIPGQGHGDGILVPEEDTGLDGFVNPQEPGYSNDNPDPNRDDWSYKDKNDYTRINGTEGNRFDSDRSGIPDTEDINNNGVLDTKNSYYEYTIALDDPADSSLVQDSVPVGNPGGWRLFRIPLWNNPRAVVGGSSAPDSTLIEYARMWITGCDSTLIQIASIEIVESNWLETGISDPDGKDVTLTVSDKVRVTRANTDENLDYTPPPGVAGEIDRTTKIRKMEQSIVLQYENLAPGNAAFIYRNFGDKMDFTDYTSLKMWVHGPDDFPDPSAGQSDAEIVLRFGADKDNYYEYRAPIYRGWANENSIEAVFATCTGVKLKQLKKTAPGPVEVPADTVGSAIYTLKGSPNLQNIKVVYIGFRNRRTASPMTGQIWLDELRMDALRDMTGSAVRASLTADLSGFINLTGKITRRSADFHDMNSKKGSGTDNTDWNTSVAVNLDRFTPKRWNLSVPVTMNTTRSDALPRLMSGSDIILGESEKLLFKSSASDRNYTMTYRKNSDPSQKGIAKYVLNWGLEKWSASYTWGERTSKTPSTGDQYEQNTQAKVTYDVNPQAKTVGLLSWAKGTGTGIGNSLGGLRFSYTPNQLSYDVSYEERNKINTNIDDVSDTTKTEVANKNFNFGYDPIANILKYRFRQSSSQDMVLKLETSYTEMNDINFTGPRFRYFNNQYTYTANYTERNNPRYSLSSQGGGRQLTMDRKFDINASVEWGKFFEDFSGKPRLAEERSALDQSTLKRKDILKNPDTAGPPKSDKKKPKADKGKSPSDVKGAPPKEEQSSKEPDVKGAPPKKEKPSKEAAPAGNDSTAQKPGAPGASKPSEPEKPKKPGVRTKLFLAVSQSLSPINFRYSKNNQLNFAGISSRPGFMIRFGRGTVAPPDSNTVVSRQNTESQTQTVMMDTSIKLPLDMGLSATGDMNNRTLSSLSANTRSKESSLPTLDFKWSNVEKRIPLMKKYMNNIQLSSRYSLKKSQEWANESVQPIADKTSKNYSPLVNMNGVLFGGLQTSLSYSMSSETNLTLSGITSSTILTDRNDISADFRYNVSPSSGILNRFKLKSSIDLQLTVTTSQDEQRRSIENKATATTARNSRWTVSPKADYRFSEKFTGSAMIRVENSKDLTNKVHKLREVSISGRMTF